MSSSRERKNAAKKLRAFTFTQKVETFEFREKIDSTFSSVFLPNSVELSERDFNGTLCDVLRPPMFSKRRVLLYVHGGAFVAGSRKAYRPFVSSLANAISCQAILPEFKLAPSHPYPYSLEDIQGVFRLIYAEEQFRNGTPEIVVAADSSGASMAAALILSLKSKFRAGIKKLILFSPWLDVSEESDVFQSRRSSDDVFTVESVRYVAESYADAAKRENPLVSPLRAEREMLDEFPDTLIQCGENELFLETNRKFRSKLLSVGAKCELDVWEGMMPLFQMADDILDESHRAVEKIGKLLTDQDHSNESVYEIGLALKK